MVDTNYIGSVVKILESPKQISLNNSTLITEFRVQFPQIRNSKIAKLVFWGSLARDVSLYYKVNDYIIIEGYLSIRNNKILNANVQKQKRVEISVLRVYPFLLTSNRLINKI